MTVAELLNVPSILKACIMAVLETSASARQANTVTTQRWLQTVQNEGGPENIPEDGRRMLCFPTDFGTQSEVPISRNQSGRLARVP